MPFSDQCGAQERDGRGSLTLQLNKLKVEILIKILASSWREKVRQGARKGLQLIHWRRCWNPIKPIDHTIPFECRQLHACEHYATDLSKLSVNACRQRFRNQALGRDLSFLDPINMGFHWKTVNSFIVSLKSAKNLRNQRWTVLNADSLCGALRENIFQATAAVFGSAWLNNTYFVETKSRADK